MAEQLDVCQRRACNRDKTERQAVDEPKLREQRGQRRGEEVKRHAIYNLKDKLDDAEPPIEPKPVVLDPNFTSWNVIQSSDSRNSYIGIGGFGTVYKVMTDREQTLALKVVQVRGNNKTSQLEDAIRNEENGVKILQKIRHQNIVLFVKTERTPEGQLCIFTEFISGHSLLELMQKDKKPLDEYEVKKFAKQICATLNFLHCQQAPILHRDIKCSNIMLSNEGIIKLIDFGFAKEIAANKTGVSTTNLRGTWHFLAPELFQFDEVLRYTPKTDVWAFGCTVFEMLTMLPPNSDVKPQGISLLRVSNTQMPDLPAEVSADLRDFYRRCVAREPGERADTMELMEHRFLSCCQ